MSSAPERDGGDEAEACEVVSCGLVVSGCDGAEVLESAYRADAVSPAGAGGLTQLMPATARDLGVRNRFDVEESLSGGADYLARQLLRFGDLRLALAAYNAGPERVARLGRVPEIEETRNYVVSVIDCYLALAAGRDVRPRRSAGRRRGSDDPRP